MSGPPQADNTESDHQAAHAESDNDSAFEISDRESTDSLPSSFQCFIKENGRTYHAYHEGKHMLPNDEDEKDRLDLQHHLFRLTFGGKLFTCPVEKTMHRVLDIGTGTGIWAIEFGDEHPESAVIGIDLSPIQPSFLPPNVTFLVDDVEQNVRKFLL
jgi:SAM-dependent methyltransferase